jgi:hypothetical protein
MVVIQIPVKNHVKKYLQIRFGERHTVTKKTFLGLFIAELLEKKVEKPDWFDGCKYEIEVPEYFFNTKGHSINRNKLRFVGEALERMFLDDFYNFVDLELKKGNANAYASVKMFLKIHNISECELKLESMYRNYQRHCNDKIKPKKVLVN